MAYFDIGEVIEAKPRFTGVIINGDTKTYFYRGLEHRLSGPSYIGVSFIEWYIGDKGLDYDECEIMVKLNGILDGSV